jgi:ferrous iron transport protein B
LNITENQTHIIEHVVKDMEEALKTDREAALADMRYCYIEKICSESVIKKQETKEQQRSEKIDEILTHKYFGIPIFFGIMLFIFWMTFNVIGAPLQEFLEVVIALLTETISNALINIGVSDWVYSLVINGIFVGVGSVLSFLPIIVVLFFFLSLLEDSGYMARVAFLMDKLLRKIGLSGRSFVPMLIGFGCSVPAIMATRTLASERDRKMTIVLTPFMSCSAKLPIYGMITAAFFPDNAALVMIGLYVMGIAVAVLSGLLLKNTIFKGEPVPFVMELPAYRIPSRKSVLIHMWEKAKDFIQRAFTIIFLASIVIWFLQGFNWSFEMVEDSSKSILAYLGSMISPIFRPLGFNDWRASTALITGLTAKEAVVSTLSVLTGAATDAQLLEALFIIFTPISAFAFLTFVLLYMPCVAAFAATKRELGSLKYAVLTALYQTVTAYTAGAIVYQIGSFIGG